jgi:hypothetical protein
MRAFMIVLALGTAASLGAQVPATPTPATSPAPAGPPKQGGGEFRVSGFVINGDRSFDFNNNVSNEAGSINGLEVVLRNRAIGLAFRSMSGTFGLQPHVTSADLKVLLFPRVFSIFAGAGRRALWSDINASTPSVFDLGLVGISSTATIGGTGLRTNVTGTYYLPQGESKDKIKSGMEGEASMMFKLPAVPFFLQLGYRTELFTSKNGSMETPEEVRGIRLGGGLQIGGR